MAIEPNDFRAALGRFASGVTVVTSKDALGNFHGITVSAFCSVSLDPPLVLICIEKTTGSHNALIESTHFAVNILEAGQYGLSEKFASLSEEKFGGVEYVIGESGLPLITGCLATIECEVKESYDGGDHTIFVGRVDHVAIHDGDPLVYFHSDYRGLRV